MTYITPQTEIQTEPGYAFRDSVNPDKWIRDMEGKGPLFRESYPLSRIEFLVSHKPTGPKWDNATAYQLYLLHEGGEVFPVYSDEKISCFRPIPVLARKVPPVISSPANKELAGKNLAECVVTDVYKGLEGIERGSVKYLRVLEQVPSPWGARRFYQPNYTQDEYDQQHAVITKDTHLGLKIQHGIATVEKDGSAHFLVPAGRNIFLQVLDAEYKALQTERTYVNYMPGEIRSCIGCHESTSQTPSASGRLTPLAMKRKAETLHPQAGETSAEKTISYARDVQPVWNNHCIRCHNKADSPGKLNLSGKETRLFNESYESLVPDRRSLGGGEASTLPKEKLATLGYTHYVTSKRYNSEGVCSPLLLPHGDKYTSEGKGFYVTSDGWFFTKIYDRGVLGPVIGENHPKNGNIHYLPAKTLGSYASILVAMFSPDIQLDKPEDQKRAEYLAGVHEKIKLSSKELLQITNWVDTNCQYYGSYYGRRDSIFRGHPDYRTEYDVRTTISPNPPMSYE
jgi:hypothetical protein